MSRLADYGALMKLRIVVMALFAAATGFVLGSVATVAWPRLAAMLLGAGLVGAGGNALNQWWERDADALMMRTRLRPLPAGRLAPRQALAAGLACALAGLAVLAWRVNGLSSLTALAMLVSYVGLYTPLKRRTSLCTLVGAIPGALPPVIGWAAARGSLQVEAWVLFGILFLWQLPHFLAIAWVHREDYARAGFRMLPVLEPDGGSTARQMVVYGLALIPVSLLPVRLEVAGPVYCVGATAAGIGFVALALWAARVRSVVVARRLFLASVGYLPIVLALLMLDNTVL